MTNHLGWLAQSVSSAICRQGNQNEPGHTQHGRATKVIEPEARPPSLIRRAHQPPLEGIVVHVIELLETFSFHCRH